MHNATEYSCPVGKTGSAPWDPDLIAASISTVIACVLDYKEKGSVNNCIGACESYRGRFLRILTRNDQ